MVLKPRLLTYQSGLVIHEAQKLYILFFFYLVIRSLINVNKRKKRGRWCYEFRFVKPIKVLLVCTVLKILCHLSMVMPSKCYNHLLCSACVCLYAAQDCLCA